METIKSQKNYLLISIILFIISCNCQEKNFYNKIKESDRCMIACSVKYNDKKTITVVMEKRDFQYEFEKNNIPIDDETVINHIRLKNPIDVSMKLYYEFYGQQVISQHRIDSLFNLGLDKLLFTNTEADIRVLDTQLENLTVMEEHYAIKLLFDHKILLKQDCESGYYREIK